MTREELEMITRPSARGVMDSLSMNGVDAECTIEAAMNEEWWRGYYAGMTAMKDKLLEQQVDVKTKKP